MIPFRPFAGFGALAAGAILALAAAPAGAEPFSGEGYLLACGEEGCFLNARGFILFAPQADSAAMATLQALDPISAVQIAGDLGEIGDSSATITLTAATRIDNPDEGNLRALQGAWKPVAEEAPYHIAISGLDWSEFEMDQETARFLMSPGPACADGVIPGGTAISLYRYGDDPGADACWQIEYVDDSTLVLRDFMGGQGAVELTRLQD